MKLRKRYVPDLQEMASLCEANYARLLKLLPQEQERVFVLEHESLKAKVRLFIEDDQRYTTMLIISQEGYGPKWLQPQSMQVRMYHDARMAEVISYQTQKRFEGRYYYPNPSMRMPDEKVQINRFLSEWLEHCFKYGQTAQPVFIRSTE